jgi:hypothetical protein
VPEKLSISAQRAAKLNRLFSSSNYFPGKSNCPGNLPPPSAAAPDSDEQITGEIGGVRAISNNVVTALESIHDSIDAMRGHIAATATSVDEPDDGDPRHVGMQGTAAT